MPKHRPNSPELGFSPELETQIFFPGSKGLRLDVGKGVLKINDTVSYPKREEYPQGPLLDLLLEEPDVYGLDDGRRKFILPNNYITFAQVFNDALSGWTESTSEQKEIARKNLNTIGLKIGRVIDLGLLAPKNLGYKNILLSKESEEVKLLPPIEFQPVRDKEVAKTEVVDDFLTSCLEGATPGSQLRQFIEVSKSFTDGIEGRNV